MFKSVSFAGPDLPVPACFCCRHKLHCWSFSRWEQFLHLNNYGSNVCYKQFIFSYGSIWFDKQTLLWIPRHGISEPLDSISTDNSVCCATCLYCSKFLMIDRQFYLIFQELNRMTMKLIFHIRSNYSKHNILLSFAMNEHTMLFIGLLIKYRNDRWEKKKEQKGKHTNIKEIYQASNFINSKYRENLELLKRDIQSSQNELHMNVKSKFICVWI